MKRIFSACLGVLIIGILVATPVLAAGYSYDITISEPSGISYTQKPFIANVNNIGLISQGYLSSTGLDGIVKDGDTSLPTMIADDKVLFVDNLNANQSKTVQYTTGNTPVTSMPIITGEGGYFETPANPELELGNIFKIEISAYVKMPTGGDVYNGDILAVPSSLAITAGDGNIEALINETGGDTTLILSGISSGVHNITLSGNGLIYTLTVDSTSTTTTETTGVPLQSVEGSPFIWDDSGCLQYINSIQVNNLPSTPGATVEVTASGVIPGDTPMNYITDSWTGFAPGDTMYCSIMGFMTTVTPFSSGSGIGTGTLSFTNDNTSTGNGLQPDVLYNYVVFDTTGNFAVTTFHLGDTSSSYVTSVPSVWYQPITMIQGTDLPDLDGTQAGVITWGVNPGTGAVTVTTGGFTPTAPTVYGAGNYGAFNNGGAGTINLQNPLAPNQLYTELDASKIPFGSTINELLNEGGVPQALWWFPFIFVGAVIIGMLVYDATQRTGGQGSLLTMCITIEILLVIFGVMGVTGVSGMIPLWSALLFPIPAVALILSRRHVGWG